MMKKKLEQQYLIPGLCIVFTFQLLLLFAFLIDRFWSSLLLVLFLSFLKWPHVTHFIYDIKRKTHESR